MTQGDWALLVASSSSVTSTAALVRPDHYVYGTATDAAGLDAADPMNVCNRGRGGAGVQLEVSLALRRSPRRALLVRAVREALLAANA